jgi:hypothetical protein
METVARVWIFQPYGLLSLTFGNFHWGNRRASPALSEINGNISAGADSPLLALAEARPTV